MKRSYLLLILSPVILLLSCTESGPTWEGTQTIEDRLVSVEGFDGPEAVRYDPDMDLYFVSNFNGGGGAADSNGYISTVTPDGEIDTQRFITGTEQAPLHAPRGMHVRGDQLWAVDLLGVHVFQKNTGDHINFIDFSELNPGFLNDIYENGDGEIFVTDTGTSSVYRIVDMGAVAAFDSLPAPPNGITRDPASGNMVLAPWGGSRTFHMLDGEAEPGVYAESSSGGDFDGIEFVYDRLIAASQTDSSLHVLRDGESRVYIELPGRPADIGIDTRRMQVAVPYIALNRVDIWQLPEE